MTTIPLTNEERGYLVGLLDIAYREKHAELRRTEFSSTLHDQLRYEERLLKGLLDKVQAATTTCQT